MLNGGHLAASSAALEGANARAKKNRGPIFILVTNLVLSIGGPLCMIVFLSESCARLGSPCVVTNTGFT